MQNKIGMSHFIETHFDRWANTNLHEKWCVQRPDYKAEQKNSQSDRFTALLSKLASAHNHFSWLRALFCGWLSHNWEVIFFLEPLLEVKSSVKRNIVYLFDIVKRVNFFLPTHHHKTFWVWNEMKSQFLLWFYGMDFAFINRYLKFCFLKILFLSFLYFLIACEPF